ncbi:hypothetical protein K5L04_07030 [Flavobacterium psychrophilum]|uniref:hypothetical protein n=1 Tax=Flavobacterium psychrophilum TaxID=96345 RepID=UPI001C8F486F|nr:hypothetical protein [Flavobacterium psychrophilum]QZK99484.1 hypothetical protein K5L04_07030 [Flavobacterium psychrophilum]
MKIAILGWGSLIWKPDNLAYKIESKWSTDGPIMPIEFARVSNDGRLTLVITDEGTEVTTLFAISTFESLEQSILNLAIREGSSIANIGFYEKTNKQFSPSNFKYQKNIENWIEQNNSIDAVIWTNLSENWKIKIKDRIQYLSSLNVITSKLAEEYIRKTPKQIKTQLRTEIEEKLNWKPLENNL